MLNNLQNNPAHLDSAAFIVENSKITYLNPAAEQYQLKIGDDVRELILIGLHEYKNFKNGLLYLGLQINGQQHAAAVTCQNKRHIFSLLKEFDSTELRAMSLAGHHLLKPLQESLAHMKLLQWKINKLPTAEAENLNIEKLNRTVFQMMRSINNMTDASIFSFKRTELFRYENLTEMLESKCQWLMSVAPDLNRKIVYSVDSPSIYTMMDSQAIERAFCNLISNAVKFSPENSEISIKISSTKNIMLITISNKTVEEVSAERQLFNRYLRNPMPENNRNGIGLGMTVVRTIAAAHKGTLYIQCKNKKEMSVTMSVGIVENSETLHSPSEFQIIYGGGYNTALVELSDILPASMYKLS